MQSKCSTEQEVKKKVVVKQLSKDREANSEANWSLPGHQPAFSAIHLSHFFFRLFHNQKCHGFKDTNHLK